MNNQALTFGEVRAMYFDDTALELPPVPLYRLDVKGSRHYFTVGDDGEPQFYSGVTSITSATLPKPEQLIKWIADMGYNEAIKYRDERAAYGTLLHTILAHVLINGSLDLETVDSLVYQYVNREKISVNIWQFAEDIKQDVIAFAQWVADYDVKPLAIEISLCSKAMGVAGTADLPCLMTIPTKGQWGEVYASGARKGEPKESTEGVRTMCIVDFKSGRKSYGGDLACAAQLRLYKALWVDNFANYGDEMNGIRLFNWSPKDWRTTPGYHLAEQTEHFSTDQMDAMLNMHRLSEKPVEEKTKTFYSGVVTLGADPAECFQVKTAPELAHERLSEEQPTDIESRQWDYLTVGKLMEMADKQATYDLFTPTGKALR